MPLQRKALSDPSRVIPEDTSGPRGSGPERVHWEEAGVRCDMNRIPKYERLDEAHLKVA
jgi:hypothetical protein